MPRVWPSSSQCWYHCGSLPSVRFMCHSLPFISPHAHPYPFIRNVCTLGNLTHAVQIPPMDFIIEMETFFLSQSPSPKVVSASANGVMHSMSKFIAIINALADLERQGAAYTALLRKLPRVRTTCCKEPFCFTCQVSSFHLGTTCAQRLRDEVRIVAQFCPGCSVPTVRTEGCGHVICPCGTSWRWK